MVEQAVEHGSDRGAGADCTYSVPAPEFWRWGSLLLPRSCTMPLSEVKLGAPGATPSPCDPPPEGGIHPFRCESPA